ncbi:hypothetical protein [Dyadobacter sandarakinus]|uniref:Uncharacterized protein n=1 Tax=Dyadobacter sandarakinus TaxID=2747268 RepID=A0ABX7IEG2_9BACT|nr:hypothetical protein [Dyadobacter sandarakinus]QRR03807.1 hypothetical protein HWI92_24285 [Dyadobacter sandarakinus]
MEQGDVRILKKKPIYPVSAELRKYLRFYQRDARLPVGYHDLVNFYESFPLTDKNGKDTLWESPMYPPLEVERLHNGLKKAYAMLKASGNLRIVEHKYIERIDYCKFGNSNPFRIKIVNRLNDIYDYFYVKKADASRIYGLELEEIFSPNQVNYLVDGDSLIEEHIAGIPGDEFAKSRLRHTDYNPIRIAKEFVKFNERCKITLLGDMRSYNFVMQITPDFDDFQFRLRAIDFDQQFYEGNARVYMPQFFKENKPYVELAMECLTDKTVLQYQQEEQSSIMYQARSDKHRLKELRDVSIKDNISTTDNIHQLRDGLAAYYADQNYSKCESMTEIVELNIKNVIRQVIA